MKSAINDEFSYIKVQDVVTNSRGKCHAVPFMLDKRTRSDGFENDPDVMLIAERWSELSEDLRQAIIRMVR